MRIQDEELGPIRWHIHMKGARITAEAVVETTRVQEILQSHRNLLEDRLNALGVQVEEFEVSVDHGSKKFSSYPEEWAARAADGSPEDTQCDKHPDVSGLNAVSNHDWGLDLYV